MSKMHLTFNSYHLTRKLDRMTKNDLHVTNSQYLLIRKI